MKHSLVLYILLLIIPAVASPDVVDSPASKAFVNSFALNVPYTNLRAQNNPGYVDIVLTDFSAVIQSDLVMLKWSVYGDLQHEHFEVQRSTNAKNWAVVAIVHDTTGHSFNETYNEADEHPVRGQAYYRLKQVNADGSSKYSKTIAVYYSGRYRTNKSLLVSPTGIVLIKKKTLTSRAMELYTEAGHKMIFETSIVGDDTKLNLGNVSNGVYFLRINKGVVAPSIIKLIKN